MTPRQAIDDWDLLTASVSLDRRLEDLDTARQRVIDALAEVRRCREAVAREACALATAAVSEDTRETTVVALLEVLAQVRARDAQLLEQHGEAA